MVSCQEILCLQSMHGAKVIAGGKGLGRIVRWVHFGDLADAVPWVQPGELLVVKVSGRGDGRERWLPLLRFVLGKSVAGLLIYSDMEDFFLPAVVVALAEKENFPIVQLPEKIDLPELGQEISAHIVHQQNKRHFIGSFMEQLLLKEAEEKIDFSRIAELWGYDFSKHQRVVLLKATIFPETAKAGNQQLELIRRAESFVEDFFGQRCQPLLLTLWMDKLLLLLPASVSEPNTSLLIRDMLKAIHQVFPGINIVAGIGGSAEFSQIKESYQQAGTALWFAQTVRGERLYDYEELGIYKLLLEIPQAKLQAYCDEIIGALSRCDVKYKMDLVNSLFVYFEENGNAVKAAQKLTVHRNTLEYRLRKIEEISGKRLDNAYDRLMLQLAVLLAAQMKTIEARSLTEPLKQLS